MGETRTITDLMTLRKEARDKSEDHYRQAESHMDMLYAVLEPLFRKNELNVVAGTGIHTWPVVEASQYLEQFLFEYEQFLKTDNEAMDYGEAIRNMENNNE